MNRVKKEKMSKKKLIMIVVAIVLVLGIAIFFGVKKFRSSNGMEEFGVPVQSVAVLVGADNTSQNRFSGVVESQNTVKIQKQEDRTIKQVYVEVGEAVKKGQKLFEYETDEIQAKIDEANLYVEQQQSEIADARKKIDFDNGLKGMHPDVDQTEWNLDIQELENKIKQAEYDIKAKNIEINKLRKQLKNVVITSEIDGIVQSINDSGTTMDMYGNTSDDGSYMSIMQTGAYRVKGVINEQNMYSIVPGEKVIIHSRVDDKTWTGVIDNIDTSNPEKNTNGYYYYGGDDDSMNRSSKYPFYINLDSIEGLMMGQHVYIETDVGQEDEREGLWIPSYFVIEEDGNYYVWAANSRDKLEKRKVTVGEKDVDLEEYQITDGLSTDDYIANPSDDLKAGETVTKYDFIPMDIYDEGMFEEDMYVDDMFIDEGEFEEDIIEENEADGE